MSLHANRGLYHRAVLHARQDTSTKVRVTPKLSSSSSSRTTTSGTTSILRLASSTSVSRTATSSSLVSSSSSISRVIVSTPQASLPLSTTTTSSTSRVSSSVPTAANAAKKTRKGSLVGVIIGILVAVFIIILIATFVTRRLRKRRERRDEAHFFDKDMLERPGMVQGTAAGPGVGPLKGIENENASQLSNIERTLPTSPYASTQNIVEVPASSPYGSGNPYSSVPHTGSSYNFNQSQLELGAPPMPGNSSPAPYSPYMTNFYKYAPPSQTTPPGSPFGAGDRMQNPFATPSAIDTHPSTPTSAVAWPHTPSGNYHLPLLPGGVFSNDSYRDSGYSAAYSEVHVGQAYKVQVGHSMPKYEDLTTTTKDTPRSPPPPFTALDPAASAKTADPAYPGPAMMVDKTAAAAAAHKSLPPRPLSTHTIYNPEDAYGGV